MPPSVPLNHYLSSENQHNRTGVLFHYSMQQYPVAQDCFEHSNFFKVNVPAAQGTQSRAPRKDREVGRAGQSTPRGGPTARAPDPTTSFLTATTLIYAIGAGITAAAGTRLALQ